MSEETTDRTKWAWMDDDPYADSAMGPFDSREDAIADARGTYPEGGKVRIGHVEWFDPAEWLHLDDLHERLEEIAYDNGWGFDEPLAEPRPGAEEALKLWATKYLRPCYWRITGPYEYVDLRRPA